MVKQAAKFPEVGEIVIAHVSEVQPHHVYVMLEDYEGNEDGTRARGMIHISEIASHWVRNIHDFIKEETKVVLKVLRVDEQKGHIDLSLRRVTDMQKKAMIKKWKRSVKADNIIQMAAEKLEIPTERMYEEVAFPLAESYGELLTAFEAVKEEGKQVLDDFEMPQEWRDLIHELIDQNIEIRRVKITGEFKIQVPTSNGIDVIKDALMGALKIKHEKTTEVHIATLGAPRYQLNITAKYFEDAEEIYSKIEEKVLSVIQGAGGMVALERTGSGAV